MRRWPLFTAAFLLVLAAHPTVALAGERIEPGRPYQSHGTVIPRPPGFVLATVMGVEIPLIADAERSRVLARLAGTGAGVRIAGIRHEHNFRPYLLVESIKENP